MNEQSKRNGWTPELVEWVEKYHLSIVKAGEPRHNIINAAIKDLKKYGECYGVVLGVLEEDCPEMAAMIQALPTEALEVYQGCNGWVVAQYVPGTRRKIMAYRVKEEWEVGEYVEDEPEPEYVFTERTDHGNGFWYIPNSDQIWLWERLYAIQSTVTGGYEFVGFCEAEDVEAIKKGDCVRIDTSPWWVVYPRDSDGPTRIDLDYAVWRRVER